jgi:hypothetical protein
MTPERHRLKPPFQARPVRRAFHTVLALAGWVLFVYWWWLVFRRVTPGEIRFTLLFIGIALAVIVLITAFWAIHNQRIFKHRGPRKQVREKMEDYSRDSIGRAVEFPAAPQECRTAQVVVVRIENGSKRYVTGSTLAPRSGSSRRKAAT